MEDGVITLPSGPTKKLRIDSDGTTETLDYGRDPKKGAVSCWSRYPPCIRWTLVVLLFLILAVWLVLAINIDAPESGTTSVGMPESVPASVPSVGKPPPTGVVAAKFTIPPMNISTVNVDWDDTTKAAKADHHKKVLEHVLELSLFSEGHDPALDLTSAAAKKAVEWMSEYDETSMKLLDAFHYENNIKTTGNLRIRDDIENPTNHTNKIVDRYVLAVFYFKSHPDATAKSYHHL